MTGAHAVAASVRALRAFTAERPRQAACALCGARIAEHPAHPHLLAASGGRVVCACGACALLFAGELGAAYRRLPEAIEAYGEPRLGDADWQVLAVPIRLCCFVRRTASEIECIYPSPAGPVRSALGADATSLLVQYYPALPALERDVEAILLCAVGDRHQAFRLPIDECFRLVGLVRRHFRGASGGSSWWSALDAWLTELSERSRGVSRV
jgi:hypothetical protein